MCVFSVELSMLTNRKIERQRFAPSGKNFYVRDQKTKGLSLIISSKSKRFVLRFRRNDKFYSRTLGYWPYLNLQTARSMAVHIKSANEPLHYAIPTPRKFKSISMDDFMSIHHLPYLRVQKKSWFLDEGYFKNHIGPLIGNSPVSNINNAHVESLIIELKRKNLANSTINRILISLGKILRHAETIGHCPIGSRDILKIKLLPEQNHITRYLSDEEHQRLFQALSQENKPIFKYFISFLLLTGCRKMEALQAKWTDFDFNNNIWVIPKTKSGKIRRVPISDAVKKLLLLNVSSYQKNHLGEDKSPYVFVNVKTGKPYVNCDKTWKKIRKKADLKNFRLHDLRHSFASILANEGVSIYEIQHLLGHASITTTNRYAHLAPERLRQSASIAATSYNCASEL